MNFDDWDAPHRSKVRGCAILVAVPVGALVLFIAALIARQALAALLG